MKTIKEQKWMIIVYGVILFTIGVVQLILSIVKLSSAMELMSYALATGLFIIGLLNIITTLITDTKSFFRTSLVLGAIAIACGVVFVVVPSLLGSFIVYFSASMMLVLAAILIVKAIIGIVYKYKTSWIIAYFAGATVCLVLGILAFVFLKKSMAVTQVIYIVIAVTLIVLGILVFILGVRSLNKKSDGESTKE